MKWCWLCWCLLGANAFAELPLSLIQALTVSKIPIEAISVLVVPADIHESHALLTHQAHIARQSASTIKLVVSYAALSLLGGDYRWSTPVYYDGFIEADVLHGNLYFKGQGDPSLNDEDLMHILTTVQEAGIKTIDGNMIIDQSAFQNTLTSFTDDEPQRAYHAPPSAFAVNANAQTFIFNSTASQVTVSVQPHLSKLVVHNEVHVGTLADCHQWRQHISYQISPLGEVRFKGEMPPYCLNKSLALLALEPLAFHTDLLSMQWQELGGRFQGSVQLGVVPTDAHLLVNHYSPPLNDVLIEMNKWSNNFMAKQLMLGLALEQTGFPASMGEGIASVYHLLHSQGMDIQQLWLDNGSGLSRHETISAQFLAHLLQLADASTVAEPFIASLPILGRDGTLQNRFMGTLLAGQGQLKTGSLRAVSGLAGYLRAQSGVRYVVVVLIEHEHANTKVQDALLQWVYQH